MEQYQHIIKMFLIISLCKFCYCGNFKMFELDKRASVVTSTHTVKSLTECAVISEMTFDIMAFNYNHGTRTCELINEQDVSFTNDLGWKVYAFLGCKNLPTITNGAFIFTPKDEYTTLDSIGIQCDQGYGTTKSEIWCQASGEWEHATCEEKISDCSEILEYNPGSPSGIYTIKLWQSGVTMSVYCDMVTEGGGWTVIQRRIDGSVDFYRTFPEYDETFGKLSGEFWLGLKYMKEIAEKGPTQIRTDMEKASGDTAYETYSGFSLAGSNYVLNLGSLVGATPGDTATYGLSYNKGRPFTTKELSNCAVNRQGAWWYKSCTWSNLNGVYMTPGTTSDGYKGFIHYGYGRFEKLKSASMMLRRP